MSIALAEAALRIGVSEQRARKMAVDGRLPAIRIGGRWVIDERSVRLVRPAVSRPLSHRNAWGLIEVSEGRQPSWASPQDAYALRKHLAHLYESNDPSALLRSWMPRRCAERSCYISREPSSLIGDERVVMAGISDVRAGISSAGAGEAYVSQQHLGDVVVEHMLVEALPAEANIVLHVVEGEAPAAPLPLLVIASDLAEYVNANHREDAQVNIIIERLRDDR